MSTYICEHCGYLLPDHEYIVHQQQDSYTVYHVDCVDGLVETIEEPQQ